MSKVGGVGLLPALCRRRTAWRLNVLRSRRKATASSLACAAPVAASCSSPSGNATWLGKLFLDRVTVSNWEARPSKDSSSSTSPSLASRSDFEVVKGFILSGASSLFESFKQATVPLSKLKTRARVLALCVLEVLRDALFLAVPSGPG